MSNDPIPATDEYAGLFAPIPEPTAPPRRSRLATAAIVAAFVLGALMILAGLILPQIPVTDGYSLADAHGLCTGPVGQFASSLSRDAHDSCNKINWLYRAGWISVVGGALFVFSGVMAIRYRKAARR